MLSTCVCSALRRAVCGVVSLQLLQQLMMNNPSGAVSLAKMVAKQTPPPVDINTMADLFLQVGASL